MQNIDLSELSSKKRYLIDGDENRVLELDTSDLRLINRVNDFSINLERCLENLKNTDEYDDKLSEKLHEIDSEIRREMDILFDSNVSEVCYPNGYMFNIKNGKFIFEIIVEALGNLYEENLKVELKKMQNRIKKRTDKYTKKK